VGSRSAALKIEYAIKQLGKADKEALLSQQLDLDTLKSLSQSDE
jgi:predicted GIY-YIG superfamily endonuclease